VSGAFYSAGVIVTVGKAVAVVISTITTLRLRNIRAFFIQVGVILPGIGVDTARIVPIDLCVTIIVDAILALRFR
jgi:hypothetical protein